MSLASVLLKTRPAARRQFEAACKKLRALNWRNAAVKRTIHERAQVAATSSLPIGGIRYRTPEKQKKRMHQLA